MKRKFLLWNVYWKRVIEMPSVRTLTKWFSNDNGIDTITTVADSYMDRIREIEQTLVRIQERLDKVNVDENALEVPIEQVSLLDLLKSDTENS